MTVSLRFLSSGHLIGDKYSIVRIVGSGGMGIVYEAMHLRLGQRVAVEMLLPDLVESENAVARFEREARAAAHLRSPHVARVFDVDALPDGTPYMVMEFLQGRDLADELAARGPLPIEDAVHYLQQVCDAMEEAHRLGIVHRDLKPANIFLADDGRHSIIKVLDFGISKVMHEAPGVTTTHSGLGTAVYMSPEQVRSAKNVDARSDVWALGVVLYEMLAGCQPFSGDTATAVAAAITADEPAPLSSFRGDLPLALEHVVMRALEKDRDRRFADAAAFAAAIAPFASRRRASSSTVRRAEPTLQSPRAAEGLGAGAQASLSSPTNDGLVSGKRGSPPPADRARARRASLTRSRALWTLALLGAAVLASLALIREVAPPSAAPHSSDAPQVLASPLAPTGQAISPPAAVPLPLSEIETPAPPSKPSDSAKPRARTAPTPPAPPPRPSAGDGRPTTPPSAPRPTQPRNAYGLPRDPG